MELKHALPEYKEIANGIRFWQSLRQHEQVSPKIYFDSAGLIDMLTGTGSVFRGGKFDDNLYERSSNLVYALAYRKWLGEIYMLPPHTEELIDVLRLKEHLFPEQRSDESDKQQQELWHRLFETADLSDIQQLMTAEPLDEEALFKAIKHQPYHIFLGLYFAAGRNYWKKRYKFLVKDEKVLQFSHEADYGFRDVTQSDLFRKVNDKLNLKRERTANNYIDAVALCLLNEKLQKANKGEGPVILPLFFSDQEHILATVNELSEEESGKTRYAPFLFYDKQTGEPFPVVRKAGFFIIEGFVNAMRENQNDKAVAELEETLNDILSSSEKLGENQNGKRASKQINEDYLQPELHEKVLLEFFDRWWKSGGVEEVVETFSLAHISADDTELDEAINKEIEEDRQRLAEKLKGFQPRVGIIRDAWGAFPDLQKFLKREIVTPNAETDALKEFGPRYNFPETVCKKIQSWINNAVTANRDEQELKNVVAEVVNYLISGLFEPYEDEERLMKIAASVGFFFFFERYELVESACKIIREQHEQRNFASDEKYPTPAIALIHAAAVLKGKPLQDVERTALEIIQCVETKNKNNYKVWISLSYLYNLLWDHRIKNYRFREQYKPEDFEREIIGSKGAHFLGQAIHYSGNALNYLEELILKDEDSEKVEQRQLKLYYVLNNYLFFNTLYSSPDEFEGLSARIEKLEGLDYDPSYFQSDRFSDTLARYYFRCALLADEEDEFKLYLNQAIEYNERALESRPKPLYKSLKKQLNHWGLTDRYARAQERQRDFAQAALKR